MTTCKRYFLNHVIVLSVNYLMPNDRVAEEY